MTKRILLTALIITALTFNSSAEDESKGRIFVFDTFAKGLNTKTGEYSLPHGQGTICNNVRFDTELGSVTKRSQIHLFGTAHAANPILGIHRFYKSDNTKVLLCNVGNTVKKYNTSTGVFDTILTVSTADHRWQWVTWHDIAVGTDGYNQPVKYDGTSAAATYVGSCLAVDAGSGAGPDGTYSYKVAFYTATYTVILDVPSNAVTVVDNDITLTMIPIGPDTFLGEDIVGRKVYRNTVAAQTTWKLLSNGTINDNTTMTLTDSDADAALGAAYPTVNNTTIFEDQVPKGRYAIVHRNRLFLANDPSDNPSRLWYSEDGLHDYFVSDSYWDVRQNDGDSITFLKQVLGLLTIGKNNTIQKLYTDREPDDWSLSDPLTTIGCQAPYSAYNTPIGLFYLATDGIYNFNGQYATLVSEVVTPEIKDIDSTDLESCWGIYHNNVYYLAYPSSRVGASYNNRVLVFDILGNAFSIDLMNINCFCAFNSGTDFGMLYAGASDSGKLYTYSEEITEIVHRRHSDFAGVWDDMRYIPEESGGDSEDPVLEMSRLETIDELSCNFGGVNAGYADKNYIWANRSINALVGIIDREDATGHYVSQPINTTNIAFDKLYWNETMPTGGGDVTLQLRTSAVGDKCLAINDDFEFWENVPVIKGRSYPNGWEGVTTSTTINLIAASSSTSLKYQGTYACRVNTGATVVQIVPNSSSYAGQTLMFRAWLYSSNNVSFKNYIEINDGSGTTPTRAYFPVHLVSTWAETYCTATMAASATCITIRCAAIDTHAGAVAGAAALGAVVQDGVVIDKIMLAPSSCTNDWSAWSDEFSDSGGSDISGVTASSYVQYMVNMKSNNIEETPNVTLGEDYCVKLLYNKAGIPESTNIPMEWDSGWLDFGVPGYIKELRKLYVLLEGEGVVTLTFENREGESDTFEIDTSTYPDSYTEYFTNGALIGEWIKLKITSNDDKDIKIKKIIIMYDVDPIK